MNKRNTLHTPPTIRLVDFFQTGELPEMAAVGTGEFLVTVVAGVVVMAGYGGDEVVTMVTSQTKGTVEGVMVRTDLVTGIHYYHFNASTQMGAQTWINQQLYSWYVGRADRSPHAIEANPLKRG